MTDEKTCSRCRTKIADSESHWCRDHAHWVTIGMHDFIIQTIHERDKYALKLNADNKSSSYALDGFTSCIVMNVTMFTENCLKTLLAMQGEVSVKKFKKLSHNLSNLYDEVKVEFKQDVEEHYNNLPVPYCDWRGSESIVKILKNEEDSFIDWRYLSEFTGSEENKKVSNPYKLLAVAFAVYSVSLKHSPRYNDTHLRVR